MFAALIVKDLEARTPGAAVNHDFVSLAGVGQFEQARLGVVSNLSSI
jgi:hypothetical protein